MKNMARVIAAGVVFIVAGCVTPAPTTDTTVPEIIVIVAGGRAHDNMFRSFDGQLDLTDQCIKVPDMPTQIIMIAGDAGGIQVAHIKVLFGTIIPESVTVSPLTPETTYTLNSESGADSLHITLTPPAPGMVRTGVTAVFKVNGDLPIAITADASDYARNTASLPQFDLRSLDDVVTCRGNQ